MLTSSTRFPTFITWPIRTTTVTFAGPCIVRGKLSGHIVVQGETAPVTVFLIKEQLVSNRATIRSDHYTGVVVPGPAIGVNTTGQEAEGPHCTGGGDH